MLQKSAAGLQKSEATQAALAAGCADPRAQCMSCRCSESAPAVVHRRPRSFEPHSRSSKWAGSRPPAGLMASYAHAAYRALYASLRQAVLTIVYCGDPGGPRQRRRQRHACMVVAVPVRGKWWGSGGNACCPCMLPVSLWCVHCTCWGRARTTGTESHGSAASLYGGPCCAVLCEAGQGALRSAVLWPRAAQSRVPVDASACCHGRLPSRELRPS